MLSEQRLMHYEDIIQYELRARYREHKNMEYEDIISYIIEHDTMLQEKMINERLNELEELYLPFTPDDKGSSSSDNHGKYSISHYFLYVFLFKVLIIISIFF